MTVDILTFGCRLNAYESEVIRRHATALSDTIIVNTCAVTAEAERQARQAIRHAIREHPGARIVVTGCAAQINPDAWATLPGVDRVLGNEDKLRPESWLPDAPGVVSDIMAATRNQPRIWSPNSPVVRAPSCRSNRAATTAARFASSPSAAAPIAACRWAWWCRRSAHWWNLAFAKWC